MGDVAEIIKEWDGWKEIVGKYFAMHGQYMSSLKHNLVSLTLILNYLTVLKKYLAMVTMSSVMISG